MLGWEESMAMLCDYPIFYCESFTAFFYVYVAYFGPLPRPNGKESKGMSTFQRNSFSRTNLLSFYFFLFSWATLRLFAADRASSAC